VLSHIHHIIVINGQLESSYEIKQESRSIARKPRDAACFSYAQWLFDCYLLQGRYSTGTPAVICQL